LHLFNFFSGNFWGIATLSNKPALFLLFFVTSASSRRISLIQQDSLHKNLLWGQHRISTQQSLINHKVVGEMERELMLKDFFPLEGVPLPTWRGWDL